jgi:methylenetetrahydrofolate dehydrogenase (NADP+)/methenyltetrahydrofolate cyclohydrolase
LAKLLEGKALADKIKRALLQETGRLKKKIRKEPVLASIGLGDNESAKIYAAAQKRSAEALGIDYRLYQLKSGTPESKLAGFIQKLNKDKSVNGIILQLPLPKHIDCCKISKYIAVDKDVEGVHPENMGRLIFGQAKIVPCTARAAMELIAATGIDLYGKNAVVVGHSGIVGKPVSLLLLDKFATVSVCHIGTSKAGKLADYVKNADVLVVAVGRPGLIKGEWVKRGAVVIDVGINRVGKKIVGDVEFAGASRRASWITPVPGGVGPLTVVMLMKNLIEATKLQYGLK